MRITYLTILLMYICHLYSSDAEIYQIVDGVKCVGVKITSEIGFEYTALPSSIKIVENKHGKDITGLFDLALNDNGSSIILKLKPGSGDFGTGNSVTVTIDRSAINGGRRNMELKLKTDVNVK